MISTRRLTTGRCAERESLGALSPEWDGFTRPLPQGSGISAGKEVVDDSRQYLQDAAALVWDVQMNSETGCIPKSCTGSSHRVPATRGEVDVRPHPNQEAGGNCRRPTRRKSCFQWILIGRISCTRRETPRLGVVGQHKQTPLAFCLFILAYLSYWFLVCFAFIFVVFFVR